MPVFRHELEEESDTSALPKRTDTGKFGIRFFTFQVRKPPQFDFSGKCEKNEQSVQVRNFGNLNQKVNHIEF